MSETLLKNAAASGVYYLPPSRRTGLEMAASRLRFNLLSAEIAGHPSPEAMLRQLGSALQLPIWYGANFDALYDCLTDPDWQPAKGHVLQLQGMGALRTADPDVFTTLIEVLQAAAEARRDMDAPFWILIDAPARGIPTLPEA